MVLEMEFNFKLLIVVSSGDSRLAFAKKVAHEAARSGSKAGIAFVGNSLYRLRRDACQPIGEEDLEDVVLIAHDLSMVERGLGQSEIVPGVRLINDEELLELMVTSEKTLCI